MLAAASARYQRQPMPDPIFAHPRLAAVYDAMDGDRRDLEPYVDLILRNGSRRVLDVGCGTGVLACRLAARGVSVVGLDPAAASLAIARDRPGGTDVEWVCGTVQDLPEDLRVDLAVMTANVAQVFTTDEEWHATLCGLHQRLKPGGLLVFEVRDPARRAWEGWTEAATRSRRDLPQIGVVERWCTVLNVSLPLVQFRWTYRFASDGAVLTSDSTLRFRSRDELEASLTRAGFCVRSVADAPDRPGLEFVFTAVAGSSPEAV
jgi:SAM-dependent methyltransferase